MPKPFQHSLRVRLSSMDGVLFFGPGVLQLLRLVEQTGSLQTAAGEMEMSYSKAWRIVRKAEASLGFLLLERRVGGAGGGSSSLTEEGLRFIDRFEGLEAALQEEGIKLFERFFPEMAGEKGSPS